MHPQILAAGIAGLLLLTACGNGQSGTDTIAQDPAPRDSSPKATGGEAPLSDSGLDKKIEAFILEHPEVIVEALNSYAAREEASTAEQAKTVIREALPALLAADDGFVTGASTETANVVVVEFMDYHCGYCKRAAGKMNDLVKTTDDIAVVFRELPILKEESLLAAKYALAARLQGKYLAYHLELMNSDGTLTQNRLEKIARDLGLDPQALAQAAQSQDYDRSIENTRDIAIEMGLTGTPAFAVASKDGSYVEIIRGWSESKLDEAIEAARKSG